MAVFHGFIDNGHDNVRVAAGQAPRVLDIDVSTVEGLLEVDKDLWLDDVAGIKEFYKQVGDRVPAELYDELAALEERLSR